MTCSGRSLGSIHVDLHGFRDIYSGGVTDLKAASTAFFEQCQEGSSPRHDDGWKGWPAGAEQDKVFAWLAHFSEELATFPDGRKPTITHRRRPLAKPWEKVEGSAGKPKIDIGFVDVAEPPKGSKYF